MGFFDLVFGTDSAKDNQTVFGRKDKNDSTLTDSDVIAVDSDKPEISHQKRPPVIYENGLG